MATITPTLSTKIDANTNLSEIYIRFSGGRNMVFRAKTHIFADKTWLSSSKSKFFKDLRTNTSAAVASDKLERLINHIKNEFNAAIKNGKEVTKSWLESTIDNFNNPQRNNNTATKPTTLLAIIDAFINAAPERIQKNGTHKGKPLSAQTQIHYKQTYKHVQAFIKHKYPKSSDIELSSVNEQFYDDFVKFLYGKCFALNTVGKHIKNVKAFINWLPLEERMTCQFIEPKRCSKLAEDVDNIYLTEEELSTISQCTLKAPYLDRVRDQFILLAWTGCRYSDLDKLTKDNISESNGYEVFKLEQKKTSAKVVIPIFPEVQRILNKYEYNLPTPMANQKFNEYLKTVCKSAGLTEEVKIERTVGGNKVADIKPKYDCVSAHTARRSFATNMYKRGFPTLMIMAITGHKTEKAFLTYIKVTKEENAANMMKQFMTQQNK